MVHLAHPEYIHKDLYTFAHRSYFTLRAFRLLFSTLHSDTDKISEPSYLPVKMSYQCTTAHLS